MTMHRCRLLLFVALLGVAAAFEAHGYDQTLRVTAGRSCEKLTITSGIILAELDLRTRAPALGCVETAEVWADSGHEVALRHAVLYVSGGSRGTSPTGRCGAGTESYLIWLELGESLGIKREHVEHIESCLDTIEIRDRKVAGGKISLLLAGVAGQPPQSTTWPVTYDAARPATAPARGAVTVEGP